MGIGAWEHTACSLRGTEERLVRGELGCMGRDEEGSDLLQTDGESPPESHSPVGRLGVREAPLRLTAGNQV